MQEDRGQGPGEDKDRGQGQGEDKDRGQGQGEGHSNREEGDSQGVIVGEGKGKNRWRKTENLHLKQNERNFAAT